MRQFAIILTIIFSLAVNTAKAQYASVNVDYKTMEAMSEAFTTEAAMEALHNENLQRLKLPVQVSFLPNTLTERLLPISIFGTTRKRTTIITVSTT